MGLSFKILFAMVVMVWRWSVFTISDIVIITVKSADYCCIIHDISKSDTTLLLEKSVLDDCEYI